VCVCVGLEEQERGVKTAHASILRVIKGIPKERKSFFPLDGSSSFSFYLGEEQQQRQKRTGIDGRVRDERGKEREKSFSGADAG